jgi:hypothetical protein
MNQTQELSAGGNFNGGSTGYATGTTVTSSGTYKASNKYMDTVMVLAAGEVFPPFVDGKKTTWYALTPTTKSDFESVKVIAGTI